MKLMGIDYGRKKIGIAVSDEEGKRAFPYKVISAKGALFEIKKICEEEKVEKIVLGKSIDRWGRPNPIMDEIEKFKAELERGLGIPVVYEPEEFTTQEAKKFQGRVRGIDASSAAIILQGFLESQSIQD